RHAVGTRRRTCGKPRQLLEIGKAERLAKPGKRATREPAWIFNKVLATQEGMRFDEPPRIDDGFDMQRACHFCGAKHIDEASGLDEPGADGGGEIIAGADRDRDTRLEPK